MTLSEDELLYETRDGIGMVTFNRPKAMNALTFSMYERLAEICERAGGDSEIAVLVVAGAGGRAFAAGTDISLFRDFNGAEDGLAYEVKMEAVLSRIEACEVPTIAAITGVCTGGGAAIATVCDVRLATQDLRFGYPIARTLGNCLSAANLKRTANLLGPARAREIMLTARLIGADEALASGIVSEVLGSHDALMARAEALAKRIAGFAPLTLRATKEMFRRIGGASAAVDDDDLIALCYGSEDFREGLEAFLAKRPAQWKGK